jgi:outer membrane immunogenic protein
MSRPTKIAVSYLLYNGPVEEMSVYGLSNGHASAARAIFMRVTTMRRYLFTSLATAVAALLTTQLASAADLGPVRRAPPQAPAVYVPAPPVFSWTGFYIGGNLGAAWTQGKASDSFGNSWSNAQQAVFAGGGQVGANYQFNWLVVGVEADFDWLANNHNSSNAVDTLSGHALQFSANNRWITTVAGRVGVAADNWLFYAKGGGGWIGVNNPTLTDVTTGGSISVSNSNSNSGWLAGGGIEWAFAPNWTARLEYDFLGLNNQSLTVPVGTPFINGDVVTVTNRDVQTLTLGVNYLFNWH